jgi:hypothetical protein
MARLPVLLKPQPDHKYLSQDFFAVGECGNFMEETIHLEEWKEWSAR